MANIWDRVLGYAAFSQSKWAYMLHWLRAAHRIHPCTRLCSSHRRKNRHIAQKASI